MQPNAASDGRGWTTTLSQGVRSPIIALMATLNSISSPLPDGAAAPEWVQLLPSGEFAGHDGRGPWRVTDMAALIARSMARGPLVIDENHATDLAAPEGRPAPARGHIVAMEVRDGGLWGRVEWSGGGRALLADRAYRHLSPVFVHDAAGVIDRVLRAALTNVPNLSLTALNAEGHEMDVLIEVRGALGVAATADAAQVAAQARQVVTDRDGLRRALNAIAAGLGLAEGSSAEAILAAQKQGLVAQKEGADKLKAAEEKLTALQAEAAKSAALADVDLAIRERKATPAERDDLLVAHQQLGGEKFRQMMAKRPALPLGLAAPADQTASGGDPKQIALQAQAHVTEMSAKGVHVSYADAVRHVMKGA